MLLKQPVVDALNKQIVEEFAASNQYLAMALYFDRETLPELQKFFLLQSQEEYHHAMKLIQYINDAGAQPFIPTVPEPQNQFETTEACVQLALNQELKVTEDINNLVDLTIKQNDHLTREFLQWFVTEQLEEVSSISDLLNVVKRAGEEDLFRVEDYLARNPHESDGSN